MLKGLHHVGMGVVDIEASIRTYEELGFGVEHRADYASIGAAAMISSNGCRLELFQFLDPESELAQKIMHHTAFASDDLESDLERFLARGYELAIPIDTGDAVKRFAYLRDTSGNYIELCEPHDA